MLNGVWCVLGKEEPHGYYVSDDLVYYFDFFDGVLEVWEDMN